MPSLAQLTDAYDQPDTTFPVEPLYAPNKEDAITIRSIADDPIEAPVTNIRPEPRPEPGLLDDFGMAGVADKTGASESKLIKKLFGLGGEERYQLWPEKIVREGLSAAHDISRTDPTASLGLRREDVTDIPPPDMPTKDSTWLGQALGVPPVAAQPNDYVIEAAQAMSALAGTGGLAGTTDATLGSAPFLRPALKYKEKLYKGKEGQQHQDVIPEALYPEFQRMAMSGEDISHYNFGFVNDKGHFLDREAALKYGIDTGLIDPHAGKFGALTSTLMADSSKPGAAIEAMAKTNKYPLAKPSDRFTNTLGQNDSLIQNMTPDEFLKKSRPLKIDAESRENINALKQHMKEGKPLDPLELHANGKEDGRHRAIAAKELGIKEVPVINFRGPAPAFYSAVEHQINNIPQSKMTGEQWLGTLSNKPGVKPEELQWTGLQDFLLENKGKPVTKEQVQEHIAANKIELKEVNKGTSEYHKLQYKDTLPNRLRGFDSILPNFKTVEDVALAKQHNANFRETVKGHSDKEIFDAIQEAKTSKDYPSNLFQHYDTRAEAEAARKAAGADQHLDVVSERKNSDTKYHSYQLPGGENYREMLLTLPKTESKLIGEGRDRRAVPDPSVNYKTSHWDEPNILAHVRMNDRVMGGATPEQLTEISERLAKHFNTDIKSLGSGAPETAVAKGIITPTEAADISNAKGWINKFKDKQGSEKKSLHLEEIQSDWHQQGRDRGYIDPKAVAKAEAQTKERARLIEAYGKSTFDQALLDRFPADPVAARELKAYVDNVDLGEIKGRQGVPDAPFKKSWHELALKRMIREAAEKGYDRLSWTPGAAQADRYNLRKQIEKLSYNPKQQYLKAWDAKGAEVIVKDSVKPEDLPNLIGKEASQKLLDQKPKDFDHLPSVKKEDLKVTQTEHQYIVTNKDGRKVDIGKGTVGSEAEALEYGERYLNKSAFEINNNREIEYGRLGPTHILKGQELEVGGEGMKGFYDQIIPKALEKLGKEHGVKVKTAEVGQGKVKVYRHDALSNKFDTEAEAKSWIARTFTPETAKNYKIVEDKSTIHYIDIPQSLKDTAMHKGFPLFSGGYMYTPVAGNPFEEKKK